MSLTKHNHRASPWGDFDVLANRLSRTLSDSGLGNLTYGANWVPPVSVEERSDEILLTAELPGMTEDAVEITLENNVLTISGEKREAREEGENGGKYHLVERSFGSFRRSFTLPRTVRGEGITADFDYGLLTVRLPKAEAPVLVVFARRPSGRRRGRACASRRSAGAASRPCTPLGSPHRTDAGRRRAPAPSPPRSGRCAAAGSPSRRAATV